MAQKRPRTSGVFGLKAAEGKSLEDQFNDFRKRHFKQNKDIIENNIELKNSARALQDEIVSLRSEIMEVRQQNAVLRRKLKAMDLSTGNQQRAASRHALDSILSAIPVLKYLRDSLAPIGLDRPNGTGNLPVPAMPAWAYQPSKNHVIRKALDVLAEEALEEGDADEVGGRAAFVLRVDSPDRTHGRLKARLSALESVSTRPSSPLPALRSSAHLLGSPSAREASASASPSPSKKSPRKRSPRNKQRRRRESGILAPMAPTEDVVLGSSPDTTLSPQSSTASSGSPISPVPAAGPSSDAVPVPRPRSEEREMTEDEEAVLDLISGRSPSPDIPSHGSWKHDITPGHTNGAAAADAPPMAANGATGTDSAAAAPPASFGGKDAEKEAEGGRIRRSRGSVVSYKEPSLNKKMRKPDGTTVEDAMKGSASRHSLAAAPASISVNWAHAASEPSSPPSRRQNQAGSQSSRRGPGGGGPSGAMRRKSTLPKPGRQTAVVDSDSDLTEDDMNDDDDEGTAYFIPSRQSLQPKSPRTIKSGRTVAEAVSVSSSSARTGLDEDSAQAMESPRATLSASSASQSSSASTTSLSTHTSTSSSQPLGDTSDPASRPPSRGPQSRKSPRKSPKPKSSQSSASGSGSSLAKPIARPPVPPVPSTLLNARNPAVPALSARYTDGAAPGVPGPGLSVGVGRASSGTRNPLVDRADNGQGKKAGVAAVVGKVPVLGSINGTGIGQAVSAQGRRAVSMGSGSR